MKRLLAILLLLLPATAYSATDTRYLAFQIFTSGAERNGATNFPPLQGEVGDIVQGIRDKIGTAGNGERHAGFIVGPLSFNVDEEHIHKLIGDSFDIALRTDLAVGFHVDDMMFWNRLAFLNKPENLEWTGWDGTPNTGRRLDWSSKPTKIEPQLCLNARAVRQAVAARAQFIGKAVAEGVKKLAQAGKPELFIGVIAGWETMIGQDFDTGAPLGYCALTNAGFSAAHPPADMNAARNDVIRDFISFWAQNLRAAGVPADKIYSHAAFTSQRLRRMSAQMNPPKPGAMDNVPDWTGFAFADGVHPGLSTYPLPDEIAEISAEMAKHGDAAWASSEGAAIDPGAAEQGGGGVGMEIYLGNLFNHGARFVNVYGWNVGPPDNGFRKTAEAPGAIAAYQKFLRGEKLDEKPYSADGLPSDALLAKIHRVQTEAPAYAQAHGPGPLPQLSQQLEAHLKNRELKEAEQTADEMLKIVDAPPSR